MTAFVCGLCSLLIFDVLKCCETSGHDKLSREIKGKILWGNVLNAPPLQASDLKVNILLRYPTIYRMETRTTVRAIRGESSERDEIDKLVSATSHGPESFLTKAEKGLPVIQAQQSGIMDRSFQRSISLRGYPVDSGFGDEPGGQLKRDHSGSPSGDWRGTGKFGRIS